MANIKYTEMRAEFTPDQIHKIGLDSIGEATQDDLANFGLSVGMDADDAVLNMTGFTPIQYLQMPLGKPVETITIPNTIDKIAGRSITADWETAQVIQPAIEYVGTPREYSDHDNAPLASAQYDYELRDVKRFELACRMGKLEDARLSKLTPLGFKSPFENKRTAVAKRMAMLLDEIGFRGYASGTEVTDGLFTDHNLLPATTFAPQAANGTDTEWSKKDFDHITADIADMFATANEQTETMFDGMAGDKCKLVLSPSAKQALTKMNSLGSKSVKEWIEDNYEGCEVIAAPRAKGAIGGKDVAMLIVDELNGNEVVKQYIPTLMRLLGIDKRTKYVEEDYTCATAGVMVKQPLGCVLKVGC